MILQFYFLTISYLLINAGLLLGDEYGGQFLFLLRLRNTIKTSLPLHIVLIILGVFLAVWKIFFPIPPGPVLLGDFIPACSLFMMAIYHVKQLSTFKKIKRSQTPSTIVLNDSVVFNKTGSYIEKHKRNFGYFMLGVAMLHFLFPSAVLL